MNDSKLEFLLKEWGDWTQRNIEWSSELGENVLYRAGFLMGTSGLPGDKVLCPECAPTTRRTDRAIRALSDPECETIFCWYALPNNPKTGKAYTQQELAIEFGVSRRAFQYRLRRARSNLRKNLHIY